MVLDSQRNTSEQTVYNYHGDTSLYQTVANDASAHSATQKNETYNTFGADSMPHIPLNKGSNHQSNSALTINKKNSFAEVAS